MTVRDRGAPLLLVRLQPSSTEEFRVVTDQVVSFKYIDAERKADSLKLTVKNDDLSQFDDPAWRKGGKLIVSWGYPGAMAPARTCVITSVKGFKKLQIEAKAESVRMNLVTKNRVFENRTISQIAASIADENGWGSDAQHIDDLSEVHEVITQARLTDAQFLRRWASRVGFEFYVDFDGFHFHERRLGEAPVRVLRYHTDPSQGDILGEPTIENDLTARPGRVRVRGRNPRERTDVEGDADNESDADRDTLAPVTEMIDPDTGNTTTVEREIASEETVPTADGTNESATRRARGRFRRAQQVAVKMSIPIIGDPLLLGKTIVRVEGMGHRLSIRYYVQDVEHDLAASGYKCKVKVVSDGHGGHATTSTRARGLSLLSVAGSGRGSGRSEDLSAALQAALTGAQQAGDAQSVAMLQQAAAAYQRGGNRARAEVGRIMGAVAQNSEADPAVRQASASIVNSLASRGGETESGGRRNNRDANEDAGQLEPVDVIDPDTGGVETTYRQTQGRGTAASGPLVGPEGILREDPNA